MSNDKNSPYKVIAENRRARHEYSIDEEIEAGIALLGSEIKSIRAGKVNINDAYASIEGDGEIYLINANIAEYKGANRFNHEPKRKRKLLLHRKQIRKLAGKVKLKGFALVPLVLYINHKNMAKIKIALAKGKKLYDKREDLKKKDIDRDAARSLKGD